MPWYGKNVRNQRSQKPSLSFAQALKYPFRRPKRLATVFFVFVPIIGWLFIIGYGMRIVQVACKGDYQGLPPVAFWNCIGTALLILLKGIPLAVIISLVSVILSQIPPLQLFFDIILFFTLPIILIHFWYHGTVRSTFQWQILRHVFHHFIDYLIMFGKSFLIIGIYLILGSLIIGVLHGIAMVLYVEVYTAIVSSVVWMCVLWVVISYVQHLYIADFYRRRILR